MKNRDAADRSIGEYIAAFSPGIRKSLRSLRATIRAAAPGAEEKISYRMPAFHLEGNLVYFAAFKNHIGFYPTTSAMEAFRRELAAYEVSKGAVRFPLDEPLPLGLIRRMVKFRVAENKKNSRLRSGKRA